MKKVTIFILLFFIYYISIAQDNKIDSLRIVFNHQKDVDKKAETLFKMVKLKQKKDFKNSLPVRYEFLSFVSKNNLTDYKYEAYRYLSYYYLRNGVLDSVKFYNNKQYQIAKKIDTNKVISTLQSIGAFYFKKSKPDSSLYYLNKAEKISLRNLTSKTKADSTKKIQSLLMVKTAITKSLFGKNDYNNALVRTYSSLELANKYNIHDYDLYSYYYLGMISMELERYGDALKYYKKEYELSIKRKKVNNQGFALLHLGKVYLQSKKDTKLALNYFLKADSIFNKVGYYTGEQSVRKNLFNVYKTSKQYDKAINIGEKYVEQYLKKQQLDYYLATFYVKLGNAYLLDNNTTKGNNYINKGLNFAKTHNTAKSISIYNEAYLTFKQIKDFEKSLYFYEKTKQLKDSLLVNDVFIEKLTDAEIKYQTEKRLTQKDKTLIQLKHNSIIWIGIISLLSLGFLLIGVKFYKKHKNSIAENLKIIAEIKKLKQELQAKEALLPTAKTVTTKEFDNYLLDNYKIQPKHLDVWKSLAKGESLKQFVATHNAYKENTVKRWRKDLYKKINTNKIADFNEKTAVIVFRDELEYFTYKS